MTQQILDTLDGAGIADTDGPLFDPRAHGLRVASTSTDAARGYACAYALVDGRLLLDELEATLGRWDDAADRFVRDPAPLLNGRAALPGTAPFDVRYTSLALPIAFTGALTLDDGRALRFEAGALITPRR